ncbi:MAG: MATE family efflux transporter [Oscillospiraceae bacterium]|nr:MATE family efflux transporter [Oscillospiraceae bacterium]
MSAQKKYSIDMTNGPLAGKILRFALPFMAANIIQLLFNAADVVVVGKFAGDTAQAAVTSTTALVSLIVNLFLGLGVGVNVIVGQALGSGERSRISTVVHTAILTGALLGTAMTALSIWAAPYMLERMGSPEQIIGLSTLYLRIYFLGLPGELLYTFGSALLRSQGDTKRPMYYLTLAGVANVILNLIFVIGFHWSVAGVAVATAASKWMSALLVMYCLMHETGPMHLDPAQLRIHWPTLKDIVRIGVPAGVQSSLFSLSNLTIQSAVNSMGEVAIAGAGAAANINNILHTPTAAFYNASLTFTSQNIGAKKPERVERVLWTCLWMSVLVATVLGVASVIFGPWLLSIYSNSAEVIEAGMIRMVTTSGFIALNAVTNMAAGVLRGLGYTMVPLVTILTSTCFLRMAWVAVVFPLYRTPFSLYVSYPITWALSGLVLLGYYFVVRPKFYDRVQAQLAKES